MRISAKLFNGEIMRCQDDMNAMRCFVLWGSHYTGWRGDHTKLGNETAPLPYFDFIDIGPGI